MMMKNKNMLKGALIAATVAGFFGCGQAKVEPKIEVKPADPKPEVKPEVKPEAKPDSTASADIKCLGVNECKGKGACGAADGSHSCAGKNECKGKGWISIPASECTAKGGKEFAAATPAATPAAATAVNCTGINECKGKGACGAADGSHSCAGKNECKGKGWISAASEKECTDKGGKILAAK
jgi:hypothetical protein